MEDDTKEELLNAAKAVAENAYSPYFHFRVGAAVYAEGKVFAGANIENAISGLGMCAERVALAHAFSHGVKKIEAIAIYCIDAKKEKDGKAVSNQCVPCGGCLQWIAELAKDAVIITSDRVYQLADLLPTPFVLEPMVHQLALD